MGYTFSNEELRPIYDAAKVGNWQAAYAAVIDALTIEVIEFVNAGPEGEDDEQSWGGRAMMPNLHPGAARAVHRRDGEDMGCRPQSTGDNAWAS